MRRDVWISAAQLTICLGCAGDGEQPHIPPSERSWSAPETLGASRLSYVIDIASDSHGNAMVVWDDVDGNVNAKHLDAVSGVWSASAALDAENPEDSAAPSVGMDASGNAIAAWQRQSQEDDMRSVWTSRFDVSTRTWSPSELIQNSELVLAPQLAMDGAGNATLAFTRSEIGSAVQTARFDADRRTWSAAEPLAPVQSFGAGAPLLAMAPGGSGVAIWVDGDLTTSTVWAARYQAGSWSEAQAISANASMAQPSGVAINDRGVAVAVWVQLEGEKFAAWTSRSEATGQVWSPQERLDRGGADVLLPRIAVDVTGNAITAWTADDTDRKNVWFNRYSSGERAWRGAALLDGGGESAYAPTLDVDGQGNTLVVWTRKEGARRSPWVRSYVAAEQRWTDAEALDADAPGRSEYPSLEVLEDGRALAVWSRDAASLVASQLR